MPIRAIALVLAANRDEFFARPTESADYWTDAPHVLAGRDLEKGGTWMGVTRDGRWAAVTNFRDGTRPEPGSRSRGELVAGYLWTVLPQVLCRSRGFGAAPRISRLQSSGRRLPKGCITFPTGMRERRVLEPGIYGLSNHLLDTPWPKVERGKLALREALARCAKPDRLIETLLAALADRRPSPKSARCRIRASAAIGRNCLSAAFIGAPGYGTRASYGAV